MRHMKAMYRDKLIEEDKHKGATLTWSAEKMKVTRINTHFKPKPRNYLLM